MHFLTCCFWLYCKKCCTTTPSEYTVKAHLLWPVIIMIIGILINQHEFRKRSTVKNVLSFILTEESHVCQLHSVNVNVVIGVIEK